LRQAESFSGGSNDLLERAAERLGPLFRGVPLRSSVRSLFHFLLMLRTRGRGLERVLPGGEKLRVLPQQRFLSWNLDEYYAFRKAIEPGEVALDIGANAGAYSLLFGAWVQPGGRVFAFEPDSHAFQALQDHIQLNGLRSVVTAIPKAVADFTGTAAFLTGKSFGDHHLAAGPASNISGSTQVGCTTVDAFCQQNQLVPRLIKIDVEGAELSVLRGSRQTIARHRDSLGLFVELHPSVWRERGMRREEFEAELMAQSLRIEPLVAGADVWKTEGICVRLRPV